MNTLLASTSTGAETPLMTGAILLVTAALLMLVAVMLAAGSGAARRASAIENGSDSPPVA